MPAAERERPSVQGKSPCRLPAPAAPPRHLLYNVIVNLFRDRTIRCFDSESFLSYSIWSTLLGTVYHGGVVYSRDPATEDFMRRFFTPNIVFLLAYCVLPIAIVYYIQRTTKIDDMLMRRAIIITLFGLLGLFRGYFWRRLPLQPPSFFIPLIGNLVFFLLSKSFADDGRQLLFLAVAIPVIISIYGNMANGILCLSVFFATLRNAFCAYTGLHHYSRTFLGSHCDYDIFYMGCKSLLVYEYLGMFTIFTS